VDTVYFAFLVLHCEFGCVQLNVWNILISNMILFFYFFFCMLCGMLNAVIVVFSSAFALMLEQQEKHLVCKMPAAITPCVIAVSR